MYTKKEDATSPTAVTESVLISVAIDMCESRGVAIFDISGAFLHTQTDGDVVVVIEGPFAELVVKSDPSLYQK